MRYTVASNCMMSRRIGFGEARKAVSRMNEAAAVERIIEMLENVKRRPGMYMGQVEPRLARAFINGFEVACQSLGIRSRGELYETILKERGWNWIPATGIETPMKKKGMSKESMVDEMLAIQIACYQRLAGQIRTPEAPETST